MVNRLQRYLKFRKQRNEWLAQGGTISRNWIILSDYDDFSGVAKGAYFHHDLLVAQFVFRDNPKRHIDIGSRIDGFVAHVASFREIEVLDVRPFAQCKHENILFEQGDIMEPSQLKPADSISCLNALEHFGLGRYSDPIDVDGHEKGINNLVQLLIDKGKLYLSVPVEIRDEVHFNAHRIFHPLSILRFPSVERYLNLSRFDFVDDQGELHLDIDIHSVIGCTKFGFGIYSFVKS